MGSVSTLLVPWGVLTALVIRSSVAGVDMNGRSLQATIEHPDKIKAIMACTLCCQAVQEQPCCVSGVVSDHVRAQHSKAEAAATDTFDCCLCCLLELIRSHFVHGPPAMDVALYSKPVAGTASNW